MTTPDIKPILEDLAAGRIDAAEAARRIDTARSQAARQPEEEAPQARVIDPETLVDEAIAPPRRKATSKGIDRVSVRAVGRRVRIVGDSSVATASVEGPHVIRRNASALEIVSDGDIGPNLDGFSLLRPPRNFEDLKTMGLGKELLVRVNPSLTVDCEVTAGNLQADNVPYLGKVRVTAGGIGITGAAELDDVLVQAGSATIKGTLNTGRSRVRVESGSLGIELDDHSNVTIRGEANLGKIFWSEPSDGDMDEIIMGTGVARLDIGVVMGFATVKAGSTPTDDEEASS